MLPVEVDTGGFQLNRRDVDCMCDTTGVPGMEGSCNADGIDGSGCAKGAAGKAGIQVGEPPVGAVVDPRLAVARRGRRKWR